MPATTSPLHPTQEKLLELLKENIDDPLTIRDLQESLGLSSPSLVQHHLQQLEMKGYLRRNPSNPRDYQVLTESPDRLIAYLNVYGLAECGPRGSVLDGNPVQKIAIGSKLLGFSSLEAFIVRAKGNSMLPYIKNGDLVITRRTNDYKNGDVVVCVNDGEALIKKIAVRGNQIFLVSFNKDTRYLPFPAAGDFRVEGIVKGVLTHSIEE
ncbi:MAG: S24 family peptidase [Candidatus Peribacteraceae bacterium]|jgi:repressor LexA